MKTNLVLCMLLCYAGLHPVAQVTQINSNHSLHVKFPLTLTKTIVVSNIDSSIWVSDATLPGTVQISPDIKFESDAALLSGKMIFRGKTAATGSELFISDGTALGTTLLKDIYGGPADGAPTELVVMNGTVYFTAVTLAAGRELWKSNGTTAGTVIVKDIVSGPVGSNVENGYGLFPAGSNLLFAANDPLTGIELWKSDGTGAGTTLLKDINTASGGLASSNPRLFYPLNNVILFAATDATHGDEIWKTDGTTVGTILLKDINAGPGSSTEIEVFPGFTVPIFQSFHNFQNRGYFNAYDGTSTGEIWSTDGNPANTSLLKDVVTGTSLPLVLVIDAVNMPTKFIFPVSDGAARSELWQSDGTPGGTVLFKAFTSLSTADVPFVFIPFSADFFNGSFSQPLFQGTKFFFTAGTTLEGHELWISDGSLAGTNMVKDIFAGTGNGINVSSGVTYLYTSSLLFFKGTTSAKGNELWKTDGTSANTTIVADIFTNAGNSDPELTTISNGNKIIFSATNGDDAEKTDLYVVDGNFLPVPLKLGNFSVSAKGRDAILRWTTLQEFNSKDFTIERSDDGRNFEPIGMLAAMGNSTTPHAYTFLDEGIVESGKDRVYYRLLGADRDEKKSYSNVIRLNLKPNEQWDVRMLSNPVQDQVRIMLEGTTGTVMIFIRDMNGKTLYKNSLVNENGQFTLPVSLQAGTYVLTVETLKDKKSARFVKQ